MYSLTTVLLYHTLNVVPPRHSPSGQRASLALLIVTGTGEAGQGIAIFHRRSCVVTITVIIRL